MQVIYTPNIWKLSHPDWPLLWLLKSLISHANERNFWNLKDLLEEDLCIDIETEATKDETDSHKLSNKKKKNLRDLVT